MTVHEELLAERVRAMGAELGTLHFELESELSWIQQKWRGFRELYEDNDERFELLNTVASGFFYIVHRFFYEDAMLHLTRLTDAETSRVQAAPKVYQHQSNLSVRGLSALISDPDLKAKLNLTAEQARTKCQFARDWRDKQLAHFDLATYRLGPVQCLPRVDVDQIELTIDALRSVLQLVRAHYGFPWLTPPVSDPWGAKSLLYYLEGGRRAVQAEQQG